MKSPRGSFLFLLCILALLLYRGRAVLPQEGPPAFFMEKMGKVFVELGSGFRDPGIHQFSDGSPLGSVIEMTTGRKEINIGPEDLPAVPLRSGESLNILHENDESVDLTRGWMPAGQRFVLGVPLHPDRMTMADWEYLPGIGPRLAEAIEEDRQQNGDFESLEALDRVRGIGPKRIERWREYFLSP